MNLENLNLVELDAQEKASIDGGFWNVVGGAIAWFIYETLDNFDECMESYEQGFNETADTQCTN